MYFLLSFCALLTWGYKKTCVEMIFLIIILGVLHGLFLRRQAEVSAQFAEFMVANFVPWPTARSGFKPRGFSYYEQIPGAGAIPDLVAGGADEEGGCADSGDMGGSRSSTKGL